ncbi:MAG: PEPxxWA-CTERM sorting domain-containing protein [Candidatus Sphingomonas colombiensis]|nr:PEPxxWA-CTERM sorting domain-containing protein [Sphingomonas sp.]WEK41879.1 MAG: PEPxxWA-CTERM sorting domain-containing protein [Sphingomonas sp.]
MKFLLSGAACIALALSAPADATITLTAIPAAGVNMSNIHVGDTFNIEFYLGGAPGEHFTGDGVGVGYSAGITEKFVSDGPNYLADASTNPLLFVWNFTAIGAGPATVGGFFSSASDRTWSNSFHFTVFSAAPEPATWGLMILGFGAVGGMMRRKSAMKTNIRFA